jgi:hypothetical protein
MESDNESLKSNLNLSATEWGQDKAELLRSILDMAKSPRSNSYSP